MTTLAVWFVAVFLVGLAAGTVVNWCAMRLPYEKSLLWPGPRCRSCLQPIRLVDCLPVVGFLLLRGRCRACRAAIPWKYPVVELLTGLLFVALFAAVCGVVEVPLVGRRWQLRPEANPWPTLVVFTHYATLVCFLLVASLCDLADMEIPLPLTFCGTVVGLVFATLFPWPFPATNITSVVPPYPGLYPWPIWQPKELPAWLGRGSWQLGLATGLAGAVAGMVLLRGVRFLFGLGRGMEGMGVGDADLMMMAGAFIGWQPVVVAFFVSVIPGLLFAVVSVIVKGEQALPFGPSLAVGVILTVLGWPVLGRQFQIMFFDPLFLAVMGGGGGVALLAIAFLLRITRPVPHPPVGTGS